MRTVVSENQIIRRSTMKKLLAILLTVCFMLGVFAACTNDNTPANTNELPSSRK